MSNRKQLRTTLETYQRFTDSVAIYRESVKTLDDKDKALAIAYAALEVCDEAGEVAGKIKKWLRADYDIDQLREVVKGEMGDVLFPLTCLCSEFDIDIGDIIADNQEKLESRAERGVLQGNGDNR